MEVFSSFISRAWSFPSDIPPHRLDHSHRFLVWLAAFAIGATYPDTRLNLIDPDEPALHREGLGPWLEGVRCTVVELRPWMLFEKAPIFLAYEIYD
jgi:hypothetical protein